MISEKNLGGEMIKQPEEERKYENIMNVLEKKLEEMDRDIDIKAAGLLPPEKFKELVELKSRRGIKAEQAI